MVHPAGFDKERSDDEREHRRPQVEKRRATRNKVSNPIFFIAKNIGQKEKILTDKAICQSQDLLFTGLLTTLEKGKKKWYTRRDSNPRPSTPEADALSS